MYSVFTNKSNSRFTITVNEKREAWFEVTTEEINVRVTVAEQKYGQYQIVDVESAIKNSSGIINSKSLALFGLCQMLHNNMQYNLTANNSSYPVETVLMSAAGQLLAYGWTEVK